MSEVQTSEDSENEAAAPSEVVTGLSWPRVAVLGAALAFLGFAFGIFISKPDQPGADSVDVGFYQDMSVHHDQAVQIASMEARNGENSVVRGFAEEVIIFQRWELGVMDRSLHDWGYSSANRPEMAMEWMGMPTPYREMYGLIDEERMQQMQDARGAEADAMFLELMAEHHLGGIHMAEYAATKAGDHDVREFAERMAYNQSVEINEYAQTAERLGIPVQIERVPIPDKPGQAEH